MSKESDDEKTINGLLETVSDLRNRLENGNMNSLNRAMDFYNSNAMDDAPQSLINRFKNHWHFTDGMARKRKLDLKRQPGSGYSAQNSTTHNILGGQVRVFDNPDDFKAFVREQFPRQAEKMVEQIDAAFSEKPINEPDRKLTDDHIIKGIRKMSEDIVAVCEAINSLSDRIKALEERKHW